MTEATSMLVMFGFGVLAALVAASWVPKNKARSSVVVGFDVLHANQKQMVQDINTTATQITLLYELVKHLADRAVDSIDDLHTKIDEANTRIGRLDCSMRNGGMEP